MEKKESPKTSKLVNALVSDEVHDRENHNIPIPELIEKRGWNWVCQYRKLSEEFLEEWIEEFSVGVLLEFQELSRDFIDNFRSILQYKCLQEQVSYLSADISREEAIDAVEQIVRSFGSTWLVNIVFTGEAGEYFHDHYIKPFKLNINSVGHYSNRIGVNISKNPDVLKNSIVFYRESDIRNTSKILYII